MLILLAIRRLPVYREYLLAALAREHQVWLLSDHPPTWESRYLAGATVLDLADADALAAAARPVRPSGVLTWDDTLVVQAARLAQRLDLPTSPPEAVLLCRDKHGTRQALRAAGVPQAGSVLVTSLPQARQAAAGLGYPLVLKPRALYASVGVVRVDTADQLAGRFRVARGASRDGGGELAGSDVLIEQYLDGPEISVDAGWLDGELSMGFVARKRCDFPPYFEEVGHLVRANDPLLRDEALLGVLRAAHAAVGYTTGWTHTELRLTPDGPKVVEINARVGGDRIPDLARLALGVDTGRAAAALACGRRPDLEPTLDRVAAVRFRYPERDCIVRSVEVDAAALPAEVDSATPVVLPGQELRLPPHGFGASRYALITTVADSDADCLAGLDKAAAAVRLNVLRWL
ncbi:ATP-grasp domain-containing protein [Jatrophihabitans sp.]|uniref:ATP-grasp domain-containing protein n=1 Tax=Jatrophihabitans sp. TaxID=1932789 RepID=UPI002B9C6805|nr:ATP-grasp domain-containing protein [Jatrophihabitans sp.]